MDYGPFIESQPALRNQDSDLVWHEFGHTTPKIMGQRTLRSPPSAPPLGKKQGKFGQTDCLVDFGVRVDFVGMVALPLNHSGLTVQVPTSCAKGLFPSEVAPPCSNSCKNRA